MIRLALWMRERFFCTVYEAVHAMLPSGMWFRDGERRTKDKTELFANLLVDGEEAMEAADRKRMRAKQQAAVLRLLAVTGPVSLRDLRTFTGASIASVKALEEQGYLELEVREVFRSQIYDDVEKAKEIVLSEEQQKAYEGLCGLLGKGAAASLLFGVTGSGKTSVYIRLIQKVLQQGRSAIVLVPEIALTPQLVAIFSSHFGAQIAVLHSSLAMGERYDEWKRIRSGSVKVVIGTRSAVFAPLEDLGLIVMDEEQEHTYKSESSPRFHTKDVARFRCVYHNALLLLTSATPSVESYHNATTGRYTLYTLRERYGKATLPRVEIADMREETAPDAIIGAKLEGAINECLSRKKQVVLLLNRRGYNTFVSCRQCGGVITCPSCSISLTYHRANRQLMCHYCGHTQPVTHLCPTCGSDKIRYTGLGTQRVEEELSARFPQASILRLDADTTMSRFAYEQKFAAFSKGEYDILIGTQMVAKGLDFPNVELVGVLSADQALFGTDYRSFETTFSLLTQVIGRAGRRDDSGRAIIQTYTPDHYILDLASRQDYEGFFETEIAARRMMKYPPFSDLCMFGFVGKEETAVKEAARAFLGLLHQEVTGRFAGVPVIAMDPTPAIVARVAGKYRYKLLIKTVNNSQLRTMLSQLLADFNRRADRSDVRVFADINPLSLL